MKQQFFCIVATALLVCCFGCAATAPPASTFQKVNPNDNSPFAARAFKPAQK